MIFLLIFTNGKDLSILGTKIEYKIRLCGDFIFVKMCRPHKLKGDKVATYRT